MASNVPPLPPPPPPPAGLPAPKKVSPVVWILGGCAVLVVLAVAAMMIGGLFIAHKVQQAGLDPELIQKHPELAVVKMMVAANPDAELVSIDESRGIVTVRDKKTGKTVTMNFEDIKRGKMSFESEGKKVEMEGHGEGDTGSFTVKTDEGTAKFGAGAVKMPAWLPAYGGVSVQGFSSQTAGGSAGTFSFKASDAFDKVVEFYKDALQKAGFTVEVMQHPGGALLTGRTGGRAATINVISEGGGSSVSGTFEDK
jgi:hypothetical protein